MMEDRPGDQVREKRRKQRVTAKVLLPHRLLLQVDQVRNLRKREERDPKREDHIREPVRAARYPCDEVQQRKQVLEVAERRNVANNRRRKQRTRVDAIRNLPADQASEEVVEQDRSAQQHEVARSPVRIKRQRHERQPDHHRMTMPVRRNLVPKQRERKKREQKRVGIKKHRWSASEDGTPYGGPENLNPAGKRIPRSYRKT